MLLNQWTCRDATPLQGRQVVADSTVSARTVEPAGCSKPGKSHAVPQQRSAQEDDFDHRPVKPFFIWFVMS